MKIKARELAIVIAVCLVCLAVGATLACLGSNGLMRAMDADFERQRLYTGIYNPSLYASVEALHASIKAKTMMIVGAAIIGVGFGVVGIFFTCKWIRSLIK